MERSTATSVVVTGARRWPRNAAGSSAIETVLVAVERRTRGQLRLHHGDCRGPDRMAAAIVAARDRWEPSVAYPVTPSEWARKGGAAGPLRNAAMLEAAQPSWVLAFTEEFGARGSGTSDCWRAAGRICPSARRWLCDTPVEKPSHVHVPCAGGKLAHHALERGPVDNALTRMLRADTPRAAMGGAGAVADDDATVPGGAGAVVNDATALGGAGAAERVDGAGAVCVDSLEIAAQTVEEDARLDRVLSLFNVAATEEINARIITQTFRTVQHIVHSYVEESYATYLRSSDSEVGDDIGAVLRVLGFTDETALGEELFTRCYALALVRGFRGCIWHAVEAALAFGPTVTTACLMKDLDCTTAKGGKWHERTDAKRKYVGRVCHFPFTAKRALWEQLNETNDEFLELPDCAWDCVRFFHGTQIKCATAILNDGIKKGKEYCDFGAGFYTTDNWRIAFGYGYLGLTKKSQDIALLAFDVPRRFLEKFQRLQFDGISDEWRQLVFCCRRSCMMSLTDTHRLEVDTADVIEGPISANPSRGAELEAATAGQLRHLASSSRSITQFAFSSVDALLKLTPPRHDDDDASTVPEGLAPPEASPWTAVHVLRCNTRMGDWGDASGALPTASGDDADAGGAAGGAGGSAGGASSRRRGRRRR